MQALGDSSAPARLKVLVCVSPCKEGRWHQLVDRSLVHCPHWGVLDYVATYMGTINAWDVTYMADSEDDPEDDADTLSTSSSSGPPPQNEQSASPQATGIESAQLAPGVVVSASSMAASSGETAAAEPASPAVAVRVAPVSKKAKTGQGPGGPGASGDKVCVADSGPTDRTGGFKNMLDLAFHIVGNHALCSTWLLTCNMILPQKRENGKFINAVSTPGGCADMTHYLTTREAQDYIRRIFLPLYDDALLRQVGVFQGKVTSSWNLSPQHVDSSLKLAFLYGCNLAWQEYIFMQRFSAGFPGLFGGLLERGTREDTLVKIREAYTHFKEICEQMETDDSLMNEIELLEFPKCSWVLEVLVALDELEFKYTDTTVEGAEETILDNNLHHKLQGWARCPKSSAMIEYLFNFCRRQSPATAGAMSGDRIHHCSIISGLDVDSGRPVSQVSTQAKLIAPTHVDAACYKADKNTAFSLGDKMLEDFIAGPPEQSQDRYLQSAYRFQALQELAPSYCLVQRCWRCLLLHPGCLVWRADAENKNDVLGMVFGTCDTGVGLLPVNLRNVGDIHVATLNLDDDGFEIKNLRIHDAGMYRCLPTTPCGRIEGLAFSQWQRGTLFRVPHHAPWPLEKVAAQKGFTGITVPRMQELCNDHGIAPSKRKMYERDWTYALIKHFWPNASEQDILCMVFARDIPERCPIKTCVNEKALRNMKKSGGLNEDEAEGFERTAKEKSTVKKNAKLKANIQAKDAGTVPVPGMSYIPQDLPGAADQIAMGRDHLPDRPGVGLFIDSDKAWKVKAPYRPDGKGHKSCSRTWVDWASNRVQLLEVLRWVWAVEEEMPDPQRCPYDLSI